MHCSIGDAGLQNRRATDYMVEVRPVLTVSTLQTSSVRSVTPQTDLGQTVTVPEKSTPQCTQK